MGSKLKLARRANTRRQVSLHQWRS